MWSRGEGKRQSSWVGFCRKNRWGIAGKGLVRWGVDFGIRRGRCGLEDAEVREGCRFWSFPCFIPRSTPQFSC